MNNKFLIIISFIFFMLFSLTSSVFAMTANEINKLIDDNTEKIKEIDKEIAKYQAQLEETGQQKNTLSRTIQELIITRNKLSAEKNQLQKKINSTNIIIKEISGHIDTKEESIKKSETSLKKMLYSLYQNEKESFIEKVLSKDGLEEISREYNNTIAINDDVRNHINELMGEKKELSNTKVKKLDEQEKLNALKQTLLAKEMAVLNTKKEKDTLLAQTKNKEAEYQKILAEQIKRRDAFEKEIEDYETTLKLLINPSFLPKEGSEVLSWPLEPTEKNPILITSLFGNRCIKLNGYNSCRFHYGLDFRAPVGTPVLAMASGVVEGFGDTDLSCPKASFGKWVFIKYNNGLSSTYGHLSAISVKKGQEVKAGSIVGLSGNTGSSTGPHLHVSTYASDGVEINSFESKSCSGKILTQPMITRSNAHLNPALYLPKITSTMVKK